jgi:hypothetical protein
MTLQEMGQGGKDWIDQGQGRDRALEVINFWFHKMR